MSDAPTHPLLRLAAAPDDREAWTAAVTAYAALCWRIALRMLGDQDRAADAVQDSLLALRASARRFHPGSDLDGSAVAWVARVAVNTCHAHRRRQRPGAPPSEEMAALAPEAADGESLLAVRAAIVELPARLREAIELRFFAELDGSPLAQALGVAPGAARMRIHRGLDALRVILVRRGVSLSAIALLGLLDGVAEAAVPPPPPATVSAWSQVPLPGLAAITISTGGILAMITITGTILAIAMSASSPELGPAPPPAPALGAGSSPAPLPVSFADVGAALDWLVARQQTDGSWLPGQVEVPDVERFGASASAMLAFLGAGYYSTAPSTYQETVRRGLEWLAAHPPAANATIRTLALNALVFCEHHAGVLGQQDVEVKRRLQLRLAAEEALAAVLARRLGAGWPAEPGGRQIDTRATTWAVFCLRSAVAAELPAAGPALEQVRTWADLTWHQRPGHGFPATTTSEGVAIGTLTADIPALALVSFTRKTLKHTETSAWSGLIAQVAAAPAPITADAAWMLRLGAFWADGELWKACHNGKGSMYTLAAELASAGLLAESATAIQAMEVHLRWDALRNPTRLLINGVPAEQMTEDPFGDAENVPPPLSF